MIKIAMKCVYCLPAISSHLIVKVGTLFAGASRLHHHQIRIDLTHVFAVIQVCYV